MKESILPSVLTASAQLAALGRKNSQLALNDYAVRLAGTDIRLWEIILDNAQSGGHEDLVQQSYLRLRDSYAALPDPEEAARRLTKLKKRCHA